VFESHELGLIRDDRAGTVTARLGDEIEGARQLLEFAELIADEFGFECWRADVAQWRACCGQTLRRHFAQEAAAEFYRATLVRDPAAPHWRQALQAAVKAIENTIELLVTLRATLQGRGAASRA
jgi:hypothetical protein